EVQVASAIDLPVELESQLHQRLEQLTGKRVSLRKVTDPALIGGMVITIGDRVIDGSIRSALQTLSKKLAYHS
ncbi:MAG: F0F1 ATP synthase subunit delta, partial [Limnochordia bacterium]|nr:F0F1 ATP synthase subunit delta [Limnochordia bacterium]